MKKLEAKKTNKNKKYPKGTTNFNEVVSKERIRRRATETIAEICEKAPYEVLVDLYGTCDIKAIFNKLKADEGEIEKFYEWERNRPFEEGDIIVSRFENTRHVVIRITDGFLYFWGGKRGYAQHLTLEQVNKRYVRTGENIYHVVELFNKTIRGEIRLALNNLYEEDGTIRKSIEIIEQVK